MLRTYIAEVCAHFIFHGTGHREKWDGILRTQVEFAPCVLIELRKAHRREPHGGNCGNAYCNHNYSYIKDLDHPFLLNEFMKYPVLEPENFIYRRSLQERKSQDDFTPPVVTKI